MKFKCDKGNKSYYYEFFYITSFYKRFINNIKLRAKNLMNLYLTTLIMSIVVVVLIVINIALDNYDYFDIVILSIFSYFIFAYSIYILRLKRNLNIYMNDRCSNTIEINENGIKKINDRDEILIKWDNIIYVMISKYSITFLPKEMPSILLGIPIEYKDKVIKGLEKYNKKDLLLDNSGLY